MTGQSTAGDYEKYMITREKDWEALCLRCGACCGAFEDPCEHLLKGADGKFYCGTYESRLGEHKSRAGHPFNCVPIRDIVHKHWKNDHQCAYKIRSRSPWTGLSG
ncbi:MAG: hypothetical protein PHH68_03365 [Candidatus Omnitrophica bacterium]|nr:hypothetical protein [Candidatus Omnitrophota bacterium]MDD5079347.1 hypothetical protein [Candidatus Omnitrophota bacterium]